MKFMSTFKISVLIKNHASNLALNDFSIFMIKKSHNDIKNGISSGSGFL